MDNMDPRVIRKGLLQREEEGGVRCLTCGHRCLLHENGVGICETRTNIDGSIKTLVYGNVSSINSNPIEKKPFFHFAPGTIALTIGSWGCNASCGFCQNFRISKQAPNPQNARYLSPDEFIRIAQNEESHGTSISFSEAATLMLEWNIEVFKLAREAGLYNTIVTNGYMTQEALHLMFEAGLDAANVDIKGCEPQVRTVCGISLQPVLDNILHMIELGIHVELTTLIVPELSDGMECLEEIAVWILENTGEKTPWHLNRYHPAYQYTKPPTPLNALLEARDMAKDKGLQFVYVGNVGRKGLEDTICPRCDKVCVERVAMTSQMQAVDKEGRCENCGYDLAIRFHNSHD
ncbi:MAG: AmmeMemoRadiSam system radical SAM enzyme [Candidatus Thorarchaeota archaeon]